MKIYIREIRANLKSFLIWCVITGLFITIGFSKFSAYYENPELLAVLETMPKALMAAFSIDAFNLTTITGFFGLMYAYFALLLGIAAVMWGSDIIAKEERDRTVEFSLTLPITRRALISGKAAAALTYSILLLLLTWGVCLLSSQTYSPDAEFYSFVKRSMLALFVTQLIFLSAGLFLGAAMKQHKRSSSVAVSLLLGTYFFSVISSLNERFEFLKYVSPFKYFDPLLILNDGKLDGFYLLLSAAIILVLLVGAYLTYSRRDLYI